mgnify:CR=1 FL=1
MTSENYLSHPTFGLLFRVCMVDQSKELFATLYAQRLFFLVSNKQTRGLFFEPVGRGDARLMLETRMRMLRRSGEYSEYDQLQKIYKQTFQ